jgi:hypothetical protein
MYKPNIWQFSNSAVRTTYEAMVSPVDADLLAVRSQNLSKLDSADPILNTIGQRFWMALSEELHLRGFAAERIAIQATTATEQLPGTGSRTRVELDVVAQIPKATQSQLIDVLSRAKGKCANLAGPQVKIVLKAELKTVGDGYLAEPVV